MVDVKSPKEKWFVKMYAFNDDCRYVCFPANYTGCKHPQISKGGDIKECVDTICPILHMYMTGDKLIQKRLLGE